MTRRKKLWRKKVGRRPHSVRVYEREPGGILYLEIWEPTRRGGKGDMVRRSTGHRDKERAEKDAAKLYAKLCNDGQAPTERKPTLGRIFDLYAVHRTPKKKRPAQERDAVHAALFREVFGAGTDPNEISLRAWEQLIDARRSGAIDARGQHVEPKDRRPVGNETVASDLRWLNAVLNWAARWREGRDYLIDGNPCRGFPIPRERNPRQPVADAKYVNAIRKVAGSPLREIVDICVEAGHRISAVLDLRFGDLRLDRTEGAPWGAIVWPARSDKGGRSHVTPMSPTARRAVDRILADRPSVGDVPLFPARAGSSKPMTRFNAYNLLRDAEAAAGLEHEPGFGFHAFRRMWATARKRYPAADVAAMGGWKNALTLQRLYQKPDAASSLDVVTLAEPGTPVLGQAQAATREVPAGERVTR